MNLTKSIWAAWLRKKAPEIELMTLDDMTLDEMLKKAVEMPLLLDALTFACVWESERIVKQARAHEQWETCFRVTLEATMKAWFKQKIEKT